ncbi:unnamed protein product, partial [Didymodactylos carnosus]
YLNQKLDDLSLQYLDYSIYEVSVVSSEEIEFWKRQLNGYEQHYLPLPYDRADQLYEIQNTGVYLQEVALNQIGEFYIGGCCVFCGYPNQPELTAEVLAELSPHRSLG